MPYITIPYTLNVNMAGNKSHLVAQIDCELEVEFDSPDDWGISSVFFEETICNKQFSATPKSDPVLWAVLERAFEESRDKLADRVVEGINEWHRDNAEERGEYLRQCRIEDAA